MRHQLFSWILILALGTVAACSSDINIPPTAIVGDEAADFPTLIPNGTWEDVQFTSQALAGNLFGDPETRRIYIYLPPGYEDSDESYPFMYVLHGYLESPTWMQVMGRQLDSLIADGQAQSMILVLPDGNNLLGGSFYLSSPAIGDYESYIAEELVTYIDTRFRTIGTRESRGISGCSMVGNGALHLAFTFPDTFSSAASVSGGYAYAAYPQFEQAREAYSESMVPADLRTVARFPWYIRVQFAVAAAAAPDPDNDPFYLDFPYEIAGGRARIVTEVMQRIVDADVFQDARDYLNQPVRLNGVAIFHGIKDDVVPIALTSSFVDVLTELGVDHEYFEVDDGHCGPKWDYSALLSFMSAHLAVGRD